jgi:hypothetical protein
MAEYAGWTVGERHNNLHQIANGVSRQSGHVALSGTLELSHGVTDPQARRF